MFKLFYLIKLVFLFISSVYFCTSSYATVIKKIEIIGNDRISDETIKMFTSVDIDNDIDENILNNILKNLYETEFFEDVQISVVDDILKITVKEYPIIQNIDYKGIKSNKILNTIKENRIIKERSSYNEILLKYEKDRILNILKEIGYFSSKVNIELKNLGDNLVDLIINIETGNKAKIKKISFIGNKIFKDRKLRRIIASEEYKYWKFISGKKYLNQNLVSFDRRLLENYYKNNGYYNAQINSSFAKMIGEDEFELIFNIDASTKIYFSDLSLNLPLEFDENNFKEVEDLFKEIKGKSYSINLIDKILEEIDKITILEQYKFINATVEEEIVSDKINLTFKIKETRKSFVEKINIFGNNVTRENVIRNQIEFSEGDPFSDILVAKSINNIKSLNFFKTVDKEIINLDQNNKIINITVEEKPTGEISASAGVGTTGTSIGFGIKENNFLGAGVSLDSNLNVSTESIKGKLSVTNPNYKNSDKSITFAVESSEDDYYSTFGYKSNKTGIRLLTNFELYDDLFFGLGNSNFYEKIETNSTASTRQQSQEGNYWDSFINLDFNFDKRNQKFQTSSGYLSFYSLDIPIISDTNTLTNNYNYSYYFDLFENNISSFSLFLKTSNSLNNKDIKLSERIKIPSRKLRGFATGKIGPKDGDDYIGGNYAYSLNFSSTIPQLFEESQNVDFVFFLDAANLGGVDYDSSLDEKGKIRSSTGIGLDWYSPIGPMNFSLAHPITKEDSDKTESFRFNLGTTF